MALRSPVTDPDLLDISVVIPAHEREATIERTLASVQRQRGCRFEIIVVDDGSTDATAARAEERAAEDPTVRVVRQTNAGVSAARNSGARLARGRYLTFLDCDDEVRDGWLRAYVDALDAGADLVFSPGEAHGADGSRRAWTVDPLGPAFGAIDGLFNPGMFALPLATFLAVGGYAVGMRFSENTELGLRLTAHLGAKDRLRATTVPTTFVIIHMAPGNRSRADAPQARFEGALLILDQHRRTLARDPRLHSSYWAIAGIAAARLHRSGDASHCFARSWRARPTPKALARLLASTITPVQRRLWATT